MNTNQGDTQEKRWKQAAKLLGIDYYSTSLGVDRCRFPLELLPEVIELGFTSFDYKFNYAPTVSTFYEFGKRAVEQGATVHLEGFLESKYRKDARFVVEGIRVTDIPDSARLIMDFAQTFHDADEFTANPELLRAWYD